MPQRPGAHNQPSAESPRQQGPEWARLHLWQMQPVRDVALILLVLWLIQLGYTLRLVTVPILLAILLAYLFEPLVRYLVHSRGMKRPTAVAGLVAGVGLAIVLPTALAIIFSAVQVVSFVGEQWPNAMRVAAFVDAYAPDEAQSEEPQDPADSSSGESGTKPADAAGDGEGATAAPPDAPQQSDPQRSAPADLGGDTDDSASGYAVALPPPADPKDRAEAERAFRGLSSPAWRDIAQYLARNSKRPEVLQTVTWVRDNAGTIGRATLRQGADALQAVSKGLTSLGVLGFSAFLTAFFFYFFSTNFAAVIEFASRLIPRTSRRRTLELVGKMDRVIAGFIRGRLTICAIMAGLFTLLYWLVGVPAPLVLGLVVGALSVVPYLASVGIPASILLLWLDPPGDFRAEWWWILAAPTAVYFLVQTIDDYVLTPRIQGKSTDMAMPAIVFASIAGGILGGFYGLLLAIPVAACLKILWNEVLLPRIKAWTDGRVSDPLPVSESAADSAGPKGSGATGG